MKKVKKVLLGNTKAVIAFVLGILISGVTVYAATSISSSQVTYTGNSQTTVQGALDTLYTKANNMVPIDPNTFQTNTAKTVYASSKGVCIKRNNKLNCFKINNWAEEQNHAQQVFSDINCTGGTTLKRCDASDFECYFRPYGYVECTDKSNYSYCGVDSDGSVVCT